jgi:DNA-binding transcriptional regulator YiaG
MQTYSSAGQSWELCDMTYLMLPPDQIAELRKRLDLSQAEMASLLGIASRYTVSQWERGTTIPGGPVMRFLCLLNSFPASELRSIAKRLEQIRQAELKAEP